MADVVSLALEGKLYARKAAVKQLKEAFRLRQKELVLLVGEAGSGKSSLAQTLRKTAARQGGFFVSGKYDEHRADSKVTVGSSSPIALAFMELMVLLNKDANLQAAVKAAVKREIGAEGHLLTEMIPSLGPLLGSSSPISDRSSYVKSDHVQSAKAGKEGFDLVFGKFVRAVCTATTSEHPVAFFIDDLQWSDAWSLSLLHILLRNKCDSWFVFGAVRDNEVSPNDNLSTLLRKLEDEDRVAINQVKVRNLDEQGVREVITDLLRQPENECKSLISIVNQQTGGNPLFLRLYLQYLCEEGLLFAYRKNDQWCWKQREIECNQFRDLESMLEAKMRKLEPRLQHVLKVAACLGSDFSLTLLEAAEAGDAPVINIAVEKGFLCKTGDALRWQHDKMRQAAFGLLGKQSCDDFRLELGWKLYRNFTESQLEEHLSVVLGHLSHGANLLSNQEEKTLVAKLCLRGGEKAVLCSNFASATSCFEIGLDLLSVRCWHDEYDLTLDLHNCAAEAEYCVGNFDRMDSLIDRVLRNARAFQDELRASTLKIYALGSRNRHNEAVQLGLQVLEKLGEHFPLRCRKLLTVLEVARMTSMLKRNTDDYVIGLPTLTDPDKLSAMRLLSILMMSALIASPDVAGLLIVRLVQITLQHGLCPPSTLAFSSFGMLQLRRGNHTEAFRYGQLSLVLLEKFQATEYLPRVFCAVYAGFNTWRYPLRSGLKHLAFAHQVGLETGDIESAMMNSMLYTLISLWAGRQLEQLSEETQQAIHLMEKYGQETALNFTSLLLQFTQNLTGRSKDPLVMASEVYDREVEVARVGQSAHNYYRAPLSMYRFLLAFYFNEYCLAEKLSLESHSNKAFNSGSLIYSLNSFYRAMTAMAIAQHSRDRMRVYFARRILKRLRSYEELVPENCQNKVFLIEAELAAFEGNMELALAKFARSIDKAGEEGFVHEQALACERAGAALRRCSDFAGALPFLYRAQTLYLEWGAHAKVVQMNSMYALDARNSSSSDLVVSNETPSSVNLQATPNQTCIPMRGRAQ